MSIAGPCCCAAEGAGGEREEGFTARAARSRALVGRAGWRRARSPARRCWRPCWALRGYEPLAAVVLALLVAVLAVRALGQTDLNPVSGVGKLSQVRGRLLLVAMQRCGLLVAIAAALQADTSVRPHLSSGHQLMLCKASALPGP